MRGYLNDLFSIGKTVAKILVGRGSFRSYSQFGEDALANTLLRKEKGVYVDIGSYHPVLYSNTYAFYRKGWSGVVIDPNSSLRNLYTWLRPRDRFIAAAIGASKGEATYYEYADGAYNSLNNEQARKLEESKGLRPISSFPVTIRTLADVLVTEKITAIDVLSVDTEGMDLEVLTSNDWNVRPKLIIVEVQGFNAANPYENETFQYLSSKNYSLRGVAGLSLLFVDKK